MKWITPQGHYFAGGLRHSFAQRNCAQSEDGRFVIARSPADGFVPAGGIIVYTLSERPPGKGFAEATPEGTRILATERVPDTHEDRLAAINRLKALTGDINA